MSKASWFSVALAVICLSIIDAQPTVDDSTTCGSSALEELVNMVQTIASNQQQNAREISELRRLMESESRDSNETRLEDTVKVMQEGMEDLKRLLVSIPHVAMQLSQQALISALVCEYLVCLLSVSNLQLENKLNSIYSIEV